MDGALYFHCAKEGHKTDCLRANPKVSFVAVSRAEPLYSGSFTMNFQSAMLGGTAGELPDGEEKREALTALCRKYLPEHMEKADHAIASTADQTAVWKIVPDWITGKARKN
jgi:nitroimidazol reductase NimA-like FMN-containing flavoprotein (pyridoxamine 5'-phosphate oxidase superfamily)